MPTSDTKEWILPALIPFAELKRKDLEECVYWLLDAMGAKDLEWRTGGTGDGAADGGRDLEAHFYTPSADGDIDTQKWWIECKGRKGTVEPSEVKSTINNAIAIKNLDYLVIATNTQFSNPTRDWVKEWQLTHARPKIKLWDYTQLERYLSKHPDVVLRLFSHALSLDARLKAMEDRFWNKLEFVAPQTLKELWRARAEIEMSAMSLIAVVVNEFANGNITYRPWGALLSGKSLLDTLQIGLFNIGYFSLRCSKGGISPIPIFRAFAYLILLAIDEFPAEKVALVVRESILHGNGDDMPDNVQEFLLMPVVDQLSSEIQDVCSSDCCRLSSTRRNPFTRDNNELDEYWLRCEPHGIEEKPAEDKFLLIESHAEPCVVGFPVDKDNGCPLFRVRPNIKNIDEVFAIIKRVEAFRKAQAAKKRERSTASA